MLRRLSIKNFAVVRELELVFGPGLNLLTGETGAGKSIIVDALALVVGGRAAPDVVRAGASVAVVEAEFQLAAEAGAAVAELLAADGVASEQGGLLLRREVQAVGRSRALVNDQSVTAALLRRLQPFLVEIHGQGEQQALASARARRVPRRRGWVRAGAARAGGVARPARGRVRGARRRRGHGARVGTRA